MSTKSKLQFVVACVFVTYACALECYEGSKSADQSDGSFYVEKCEEDMKYCFYSFNDNKTVSTAQCQTQNTNDRELDVCKTGCVDHEDSHITVCCCSNDLCNLPPGVPTPKPSEEKDEKNDEKVENEGKEPKKEENKLENYDKQKRASNLLRALRSIQQH